MPHELILEIGSEEIPAGYLTRVLPEFCSRAEAMLDGCRLSYKSVKTLGTPRRLTLVVEECSTHQSDLDEDVVGPPAKIGFDAEGNPSKAAIGFAKKNGVDPSMLRREEVEGKKGEYVVANRKEKGLAAIDVLAPKLTQLIEDLPWPKSMRWGDLEQAFVRPVVWIMCSLGQERVPIEFAGIESTQSTYGHRFLSPAEISFDGSFKDYQSKLRAAHVIVDSRDRENLIRAELTRIEKETGCVIKKDDELVLEVVNLVEYPVAICGSFDKEFLEVPSDVIVSAMRSHQRYFAMLDDQGKLANRFVTIAGTIVSDPALVQVGNERVLAARLEDARFFYREDQKKSMAQFSERLKKVVFQKKLGSIGDKSDRLTGSAIEVAKKLGFSVADTTKAASLCKADLASAMVGEFPDLQGFMGARYAELEGENENVVTAILDHYAPRGASDALPQSDIGALIGLADRMDTIVGCFAAGMAPTGSADPYALRRAALGIIRILDDKEWNLEIPSLINKAEIELKPTIDVSVEHRDAVVDFFKTRIRGYLCDAFSLPADCVDAALAVGFGNPSDARLRAMAISELRSRDDFEPLASAFKRVANIIKGQKNSQQPDPKKFVVEDEHALWSSFGTIEGKVNECLKGKDYQGALGVLATLQTPVDRFFDSVLVMDKDEAIRDNRLAMLGQINATFTQIADFRQLAV